MPLALLLLLLIFMTGGIVEGSTLEFVYAETDRWNMLGPSAFAGNGLYVAYNGSHTHILDANTLPNNMPVQDAGYSEWTLIKTNIDGIETGAVKAKSSRALQI